jgi:hypothetical protein
MDTHIYDFLRSYLKNANQLSSYEKIKIDVTQHYWFINSLITHQKLNIFIDIIKSSYHNNIL